VQDATRLTNKHKAEFNLRAPKIPLSLSIARQPLRRHVEGTAEASSSRAGTSNKEPTMRFMLLIIPRADEIASPGTAPDAAALSAMMKYNESLQKAGVLLALDGLHPPSSGARVTFPGGKAKVTDGPFAEAKEVLGGYWMIQVKSREEAIAWASRCPAGENDIIEVRQVQEASDLPDDVPWSA
jgi:hypothetical protein